MFRTLIIVIIALFASTGCKDPLYDYEECVKIETARCDLRDSCVGVAGFDAEFPDFDRDTCIAYLEEHCRTRKVGTEGWDVNDITACAKDIALVPCESLARNRDETVDLASCAFLKNPDGSTEQASDSVTATSTEGPSATDVETTDSESSSDT